jgi:aspartate-semialdehyde dehydrogenase
MIAPGRGSKKELFNGVRSTVRFRSRSAELTRKKFPTKSELAHFKDRLQVAVMIHLAADAGLHWLGAFSHGLCTKFAFHFRRGQLTMNKNNHYHYPKRIKVGVIGATGMVGRRFAQLLAYHPWFEAVIFVGSESSTGMPYRMVWEKKEKKLQDHYGAHLWKPQAFPDILEDVTIAKFEDLLNSDVDVVFSSLPDRGSIFEARLLESGKTVFSNSPYRRFDEDAALAVTEVNGNEIGNHTLIKNPNCVTSGLSLVLAPILERYGVREIVVSTYQSLSGRGDALYDSDLVVGNIYPLFRSEEQTESYIRREVNRIFRSPFLMSVTSNRVYVQEGHYVEVRIKTRWPVKNSDEACEVLSCFNPLKDSGLPLSPEQPLVLIHEKGRPRPLQDADHFGGMAVAVGNVSTDDEVFDLRLSYVVNNVVRGAAGAAILNSELWLQQKMLAESTLLVPNSAKAIGAL